MKKSYLNLHFHLDHQLPFQNLPHHLSHQLMVVEEEKAVDKYSVRTAQNKVMVVVERVMANLLYYLLLYYKAVISGIDFNYEKL